MKCGFVKDQPSGSDKPSECHYCLQKFFTAFTHSHVVTNTHTLTHTFATECQHTSCQLQVRSGRCGVFAAVAIPLMCELDSMLFTVIYLFVYQDYCACVCVCVWGVCIVANDAGVGFSFAYEKYAFFLSAKIL